jgi:hypothetical protein
MEPLEFEPMKSFVVIGSTGRHYGGGATEEEVKKLVESIRLSLDPPEFLYIFQVVALCQVKCGIAA